MARMRTAAPTHPDAPTDAAEPAVIVMYRETVRPLHQFVARRAGGSQELVEDILQEVYLRAVEVWDAGHPPRAALPWLKTLARHLLINYYRKHRPSLVDPAVLHDVVSATEPHTSPRAVALIHCALARLPDRHARFIEAFHLDGRSMRKIAAAYGLSERAVEGRLARARKALKKHLEPLIECEGDEP